MNDILLKSEKYVVDLLDEKLPEGNVFHNIDHIRDVVQNTQEIGINSGLNGDELEIVSLAAWFHDTGFINKYENHEDESAEIAADFLKQQNYPEEKIEEVAECIKATKLSKEPGNLIQKVICDADLVHVGNDSFKKKSKLLRQEWEKRLNKKYSGFEWAKLNLDFITSHKFFTEYAEKKYGAQKKNNIEALQKKIQEKLEPDNNVKEKKSKIKGDIKPKTSRGVETLFRVTSKNHIDLSQIADNKANIMISINAIIISIVITALISKIQTNPELIFPTIVLLIVCLGTIIFATISTRPNVTSGRVTKDDIQNKKGNLLFFGNFYKMSVSDYEWGIKQVIKDSDFLYGSLSRDIYYLGVVLEKKYRFLRYSYNIFMYGLVASVIAFVLAIYTSY